MSCGCSTLGTNGKAIVDLVRSKGKESMQTKTSHEISCSCGETFLMTTCVSYCPKCNRTFGVTPCSSDQKEKIQLAGVNY